MKKRILITGATDGIGFQTAKMLAAAEHTLLLHGRSDKKLKAAADAIEASGQSSTIELYRADLSSLRETRMLAEAVAANSSGIDVLINNAGVYALAQPLTPEGYDLRFIVNAVAPYLLTRLLLPSFASSGRIVNLSSAAQSPVNLEALRGSAQLGADAAYAQSKLAITMWTLHIARELGAAGPTLIAVNPASFLGSKMVQEAYQTEGKDLRIGADILFRAATSPEFADASGRYFDNDHGRFSDPHPNALDPQRCAALVQAIEELIPQLP